MGNPAEALEYLAFATQVAPKTGSRNPSFDDPMALFRQLLQVRTDALIARPPWEPDYLAQQFVLC